MLAEHGIQLESIGGDVVGVPISALKVKIHIKLGLNRSVFFCIEYQY